MGERQHTDFFFFFSRFLLIDINVTVINGMIKKYVVSDLYLASNTQQHDKKKGLIPILKAANKREMQKSCRAIEFATGYWALSKI